jgi:hypothetical protein
MEVIRQIFMALGVAVAVFFFLVGLAFIALMSVLSLIVKIESEVEKQEDNWLSEQEESIEVWDFKS